MNISAFDVLEKYFNVSSSLFEKQGNKFIGACPFHNETNGTSLIIYDKGKKFDWVCMGKCKTGGEAPQMLVHGGICGTIKEAIETLNRDFNIKPPEFVTLENFSEQKGISIQTLVKCGIKDFAFYKDGAEATGLYFPLYDTEGAVQAEKIRTSYTGKKRFTYHSGKLRWFGLQFLKDFDKKEPLYICEGESDTLSLLDSGYQAIGFLGSAGFEDDIGLTEFSKVVFCSDNDEAGRAMLRTARELLPVTLYTINLGKYNDINELYQYNQARMDTVLKPFPAVLGTVSADYYTSKDMWKLLFSDLSELAALKLCDDLKQMKVPAKIISTAFKTYFKSVPEGGEVTESERIYVKDAHYVKTKFVNGGFVEEVLSNFTMRVRQSIRTDDGVVRVCVLTNEQGITSKPLHLTGELLANIPAFRGMVISAGNYNWRGSAEDLSALVDMLHTQSTTVIEAPANCGRVGNVWLMGQHGVDSLGVIQEEDADGVVTLDGTQYILRNINTFDEEDSSSYPVLPQQVGLPDDELAHIAHVLKNNLGGYEAYMALGFTVAGWHSDEIFASSGEHNYPLFFVAGKRNSGKSVLANWLMSAYGFSSESMGRNFALPSPVSMTRKLGYYSSLPQWYDDYRNNLKDMARRNHLLLSAYNRQGGDKGTRTGFGVRTEPVRATLLISGEDTPEDNAVFSRCCIINVSAETRNDDFKQEAYKMVESFPSMGYGFLVDKQKNGSKKLLESIQGVQKFLEDNNIDTRLAKNKAVFAGAFLHQWGHLIPDTAEFLDWLAGDAEETKAITGGDHPLSKFLDGLGGMILNKELIYGDHFIEKDGVVYLRYVYVYETWFHKVRFSDFTRNALRSYLKKESFLESSSKVVRFGDDTVKCMGIYLDSQPSELLKEAVLSVKKEEDEF